MHGNPIEVPALTGHYLTVELLRCQPLLNYRLKQKYRLLGLRIEIEL